jgi:hypothetical protein
MAITNGANLNSVPASQQQTLASNYLDLASTANQGWAQQYLPDLMEKEAEVFGPRTISGFLAQVGAEEAMTADQVVWSEQSRLHLSYKGHIHHTTTNGGQIDIDSDIDETSGFTATSHGVRVNDTVIVANADGVAKCIVSAVSGARIDVKPYKVASLNAAGLTNT